MGAVALLSLALGAGLFSVYSYRRPLPKVAGAEQVPGLNADVTVYRDAWGVPHIYATTTDDLFMALGYVHAQDRWWQMELLRHTGSGRLSEIFGDDERVQATDRLVRRLGGPDEAARATRESTPLAQEVMAAYARGVNAYIAEQSAGDLAVEYTILGLTGRGFDVLPWEAEDSAAVAWGLAWGGQAQIIAELTAAQRAAQLPDNLRDDAAPRALDYNAYAWTPIESFAWEDNPYLSLLNWATGSAWAVDDRRAEGDAPLLAVDLHTGDNIPVLWYEVGLHCIETTPECPYNMVGMSIAGVPGLVAGHNARMAWAIAPQAVDTQDVYVLRTNPQNPLEYAAGDGEWRPFTIRQETILVNDSEPLPVDIYETHLGPVINEAVLGGGLPPLLVRRADNRPFIDSLLQLNQARNWSEFRAALAEWPSPPSTALYADVTGNIGAVAAGMRPQRAAGHSGALPVPAHDDAYAWQSVQSGAALEPVYNPEDGVLVAGAIFDNGALPLADTLRVARITAQLAAQPQHNADTFAALHADAYNPFAMAILPYLLALDFSAPEDSLPAEYQTWLAEWDGHNTRESAPPVLFAMFWTHLTDALYTDQLGPSARDDAWERAQVLRLLDEPRHPWWDDARTLGRVETRDDILRAAFVAAIGEAVDTFGEPRARWRWGDLHMTQYVNQPLGESGIAAIEELLNRRNVATGGGYGAVYATHWQTQRAGRYTVERLPSFRLIIDLNAFERNRSILATGQSGHPASEHYDDMIALWSNVTYRDMLWDEASVRQRSRDTLRLRPGPLPTPTP